MPAVYQIIVKGHLDSQWSTWFDNMLITNEANGQTVLRGSLADQSALYGVLAKVRNLGLTLVAVYQVAAIDATTEPTDGHI
jgi:hypothetical protein